MKTSLIIDDDLFRRVKAKAALDGRKLTELVEEGLRCVLSGASARPPHQHRSRRRVVLPLIPSEPGDPPLFDGMDTQEIYDHLARLQADVDVTDHDVPLRR